ncbi:sodium-dependent glucose transporter 1-like [Mizuhopecten yessoensis]|uniref:Sodium-dependent glucose transporter 1A n=1 Tax=Mizuhopecten yessoensis TaxID=6573 RepID=A0A210PP06_MIZYE|nr:sodium-dependent glucose transporter 1-like [Mizuhopecten yessoensis]XP_021378841.1 sodium-dependent glucose transporter 1-like [Mizuhopecten yessoensis]OWF38212.1 Sodium-dependent glucose transporter 1A [Mizuhopecten yessoensis]
MTMDTELKYGVPGSEQEAVPMQKDDEYDEDNKVPEVKPSSFYAELRDNKVTRLQVIRSICVSSAYVVMGWIKGQLGPAFPDVIRISGVDLQKGSAFMTAYYTGRFLGSLLAGVIYSRMNKFLLFGISLVMFGLVVGSIPWCVLYELMIFAHVVLGIFGGILAVAIYSESVLIWGPTGRGRSYLMIHGAISIIASVLAPIATGPFLAKRHAYIFNSSSLAPTNVSVADNSTSSVANISFGSHYNETALRDPYDNPSQLYIAYSISAGLCMVIALPFFRLFRFSKSNKMSFVTKEKNKFIGTFSIFLKRLQLFNVGVYSLFHNAVDFTFTGYLSTFCVKYLHWTNMSGAMLTSTAFFTRLLGSICGIVLVRFFKSHTLLLLSTTAYTLGFVGLTVSAHAFSDVGVWVSVCVIGIPFGLVWPNFLSWINASLIPVRGEISSFINVTAFLGALLAPMLFGYMMDEVSLLWFCYLCVAKSIVNIINAFLILCYSKLMKK